MAKGVYVNPSYTINGSFGELVGPDIDTGANETVFLSDIQEVTATIMKDRREIHRSGTRKQAFKLMSVRGEGTIRKFKVTSQWARMIANVFHSSEGRVANLAGENGRQIHHNIDYRTSLLVNLDDPEALGFEQIRLINVRFWEVNFGWRVNELVEESTPFTFENIEYIDKIVGDIFGDNYSERYVAQTNL